MKTPKMMLVGLVFCGVQIAVSAARPFEDKFGRVIEAELVSHAGASAKKVKINKAGKEMEVAISLFSAKDQKFILDWMKETAPTIAYAFRIEAEKKVADSARSKAYYEKGTSKETLYELTVTNLTRQPVKGIRIDYKAFMRNHGDPGTYGFSRESGKLKSVTDSVKVPSELAYNRSAKISTKSLRIDSARGAYFSANFNDELLGVIVRVYGPDDKMITEWRTPNRAFEKMPWGSGDKEASSSSVVVE